ncbi:acyl carrier protein [candidate division FCPU426 bacterium]|nr:acyl carrier protein [candidate division FCPU426 bacterium]
MPDQVEQEIKAIVAEVLEMDPAEISDEKTTEQITQIDSVAMLEILVMIERRLKVQIKESDLQNITRLDQVIELVRNKMQQPNA